MSLKNKHHVCDPTRKDYSVGVLYPIKDTKTIRNAFYNTLIQRVFNVVPFDLKGSNRPFAFNVMELNYMAFIVIFEKQGFLDKLSTDYLLSALQRNIPAYVIRFKHNVAKTTSSLNLLRIVALKRRDETNNLERYSFISQVEETHWSMSECSKLILN